MLGARLGLSASLLNLPGEVYGKKDVVASARAWRL